MLGIMAQGVRRGPAFAGEIGGFDGVGEGADQDMGGDGAGPSAIGKQPPPVAMVLRRPHSAQALVDRLGHRHDPFLVALADDPQQAAGLVDGGDGESGGLADAEAAGIHQAEAAAVDRVADAAQNASDLGMGKRLRQALLLGEPDLFLKSAQSLPRVLR